MKRAFESSNDFSRVLPARTAAAVTTAAAAVSTAAAAIAAATTAAAAPTTIFAGFGFVDFQIATVDLFAVKVGNCRLCFGRRRHFDKSESARAAGFAVFDDVGRLDSTGFAKHGFQ